MEKHKNMYKEKMKESTQNFEKDKLNIKNAHEERME